MYLILIGCEYAGTTTLAHAINEWTKESLGTEFKLIHDHFKLPDTKPHGLELTPDEIAAFQQLSPRLTEVIQRHNLYYHTPWASGSDENFMGIGLYFEELVYAPQYYGYGGRGDMGDRGVISRNLEQRILQFRPDAVLVLVEAAPDVIRKRMKESPHLLPRRAGRGCRAYPAALRGGIREFADQAQIQAGHIECDGSGICGGVRRQDPAVSYRRRPA